MKYLYSQPVKIVFIFVSLSSFVLINTSLLQAQEYQLKQIAVQPLVEVINRTGELTLKRKRNLSFKSNGFLAKLSVDEGDYFTKGQILALLDTTELEAEKNASYARLLQAKREVKRISTLLSKNLSSQQELDNAKTVVETTRSTFKVAVYNLEKAKITAPFNGVVVERFSELGELQNPNQPVLQVAASDNNLVASVALTAKEIAIVQLNHAVNVHLPYQGNVPGFVSKIPTTTNSSHSFIVEVMLPEIKVSNQALSGQLVEIDFNIVTAEYAYPLPTSALNSVDEHGNALVVLAQNKDHVQQSFSVVKLSNDFIYLKADKNSSPLQVITHGWQRLSISAKSPFTKTSHKYARR